MEPNNNYNNPTSTQDTGSNENPLYNERISVYMSDITRGGERLVQKVSNDINEISIRRAMQIGYMMACQDHNLKVPQMDDPAKSMGYGNV